MAALLIRLRWTLWKRAYRNKVHIVGAVIGVVYAIPIIVLALVGLAAAAGFALEWYQQVWIAVGSLVVLGWIVTPVFATGIDEPLAANRFSLMPVTARRLQPGLCLATMVSIPAVLTGLGLLAGLIVTEVALLRIGTAHAYGAMVVAPVAVAAAWLLCLLAPRAILTSTSVGGVSRRRRELTGLIGIVSLVVLLYGAQLFITSEAERFAELDLQDAVRRVALILGWTPFGAPFAIPFDLVAGQWLQMLGRVLMLGLSLALVWWWWGRGIAATLITGNTSRSGVSTKERAGSFIPRFLPATPLGAVTARSLRYWWRDPRYRISLIMMPIVSVFLIVMSGVTEVPFMAFFSIAVFAMTTMAISNDFGYDGPAMWVNMVSGVDARTNLQGRGIAALIILIPMMTVAALAAGIVSGMYSLLVPSLSIGVGLLLSATGIAAITAPLIPYAMKAPGGNMWSSGSSTSPMAFVSVLVSMFGLWIPMIPAVILVAIGITLEPLLLIVACVVALGTGVGMLFLGWHLGTKILRAREPEVFATVRNWQ